VNKTAAYEKFGIAGNLLGRCLLPSFSKKL